MTQFVHIGDFHAAPGPRNAARYQALDHLIAEALTLPALGGWLWPGDLFHARSTIEDRNAIAERLQRMANAAPVVIVYGNHDLPGDLDIFARIRARHRIVVVSNPEVVELGLPTGQTASIFAFPYPTRAGLVSLGVTPGGVLDASSQALHDIFRMFSSDLESARARGHLTLAVGHVNVAGSITSVGQPNVGREIEVDQTHLWHFGTIYFGLNHIHKAQTIAGAHYPGSICRLDWGEIEEKGYIVVSLRDSFSFDVDRRPLPVPPMYHVEGELTRDGFTWQVTAGPGGDLQPKPESWRGCEVRVRYRYAQSARSVLSEALVWAEFAEAARLEPEPIAVPDRDLRSPEVAAAHTITDKIAAWFALNGIEFTDATRDKLAQLEHGDALVMLADLETWLKALETAQEETVAA